jgi:hypothetical protein
MTCSSPVRSSHFRLFGAIFVLAGLITLPACWVTSINGLSEAGDKDQSFDAGLLGSWGTTSDNCAVTLTITAKDKGYEWQMTGVGEGCDKDKPKVHYEAQLFRLDNHQFLDLTARREDVCDICMAVHWIFLLQLDKESFSLAAIDSDWLKKGVEGKTVTLATLPDDTDTLIASAKDLKAFCRKYADDKEAFKLLSDFKFKRK